MRKLVAGSLLSLSLVGVGLVPAHAAETVLPDGANPGDSSEIRAFTCESKAQIWMPLPLADNPISSTDLRYDNFQWRLLDEVDNVIASDSFSRDSRSFPGFTWDHSTPLTAGDTYTVTLEGRGDSEAPVTFDYSMTVLDDVFSGEGAGTPLDPYLITSAADMNEMRCIRGVYWKLANDIDFSSMNDDWMPLAVGFGDDSWSGVIDGNGYTISGAEFGHPQQEYASLLGRTRYTTVRDLTLDDFNVTGSSYTALLSSQSRNGTVFHNISVENGVVNSYGNGSGLLVGDCNNGCGVTRNNVQGKIFGITTAWAEYATTTVKTRGMNQIGGFMGTWSGSNGGYLSENTIDVDISVRPEFNFAAIASQLGYSFDFDQYVYHVGGLIGHTDEDFVVLNNAAEVSMHLETYFGAYQIGGAVGESETPISGLDLVSEIEIVSLHTTGTSDRGEFREIAGALGKTDDVAMSRSKVDSTIVISHANGSNNYHGIEIAPYGFKVNRIGGAYGDYDDDTADFLNEVHTDIRIAGAFEATRIGGYVGTYDNTNGLNLVEVVTSGSIEVDAYAAGTIGGFVGSLSSLGILSGSSVISAVTMDLSYDQQLSDGFGSVAGDLNSPATNLPSHFYWDETINDYGNPDGHNYLPATTSQLTNRAFLRDAGFDMENSWALNGSYPELVPGIYGPGAGTDGSNDEGTQIGDTLVFVKGDREFTTAGGELELYGEGLRGVTLSVAGTPLYFKYVTDTSGFALIPAGLAIGAYALVATTITGAQTLQGAFTILGEGSNSTMKVWTKRIPGDTEAKFYAKNVVGEGKVRFVLNGREIAWINAVDNSDPKLRSANGAYYLVRTVSLKGGKNVLEIYVDGVRERRVVYSR